MTERVEQVLARLPRGHALDDAAWAPRHRLLLWLLAGHLPVLAIVARVRGGATAGELSLLLPIIALLGVGIVGGSRVWRAVAVTLGLMYSASALVYLTGGRSEAVYHFFVVLGFVALYQDWRPYLTAVGYVVLGHGVVGTIVMGSAAGGGGTAGQRWLDAALLTGFVLAAWVAHALFWKSSERQQLAAEASFAKLYEGERAVVAELRSAQQVKNELIGIVGHEFRTPLTSIQGFARTLEARVDRMDHAAVQTCTQAIEREAKRLTRMVANILAASEEIEPSVDDICLLADVADDVVAEVIETLPTAAAMLRQHIATDHAVRMRPDHAHHLLFSLVDNAVKFAVPESDVRITSRREADDVVVEVTNVGSPISPADRERIFEAFVQGDSSDSRRYGGMGLGLHISRTIIEAYGGRIAAYSEGPLVIFRAWLPRVPLRPDDRRVARRTEEAQLRSAWAFQ